MLQLSISRFLFSIILSLAIMLPNTALALQDQGLASIMSIIDKAMQQYSDKMAQEYTNDEERQQASQVSADTVVNLSRTLGKLSYSRLQCGQTEVLAEFTRRVQSMPEGFRDPMRDAFQQGFDESRDETPLLSEDECQRLTESRNLAQKSMAEPNIETTVEDEPAAEPAQEAEDPSQRYLRIAELSGQLAFKKKYCGDDGVLTRDFNQLIGSMPQAIQQQAKDAYWSGYKHGRRLNKNLSKDQCF